MCKVRNRTGVHFALALVILASLAAAPGFADDVTFIASAGTGMMYGVARELVYSSFNGDSGLLSQLDWSLRPLAYTKAVLKMDTTGGFAASLDVRMGIPAKTGILEDSDWKNLPINGDTMKTHYSQSDCFTERAIFLDAQVGWNFPLAGWITLRPFLAFDLMDFKWTGRDGYYQYPASTPPVGSPWTHWSPGQAKLPMSGVIIVYQQTWFIPIAGIEAKLHLGESLAGSVSFGVSPVVFCNDVDNHVRSNDFYDDMWGGFMLEPKVSLDWQVTARVQLSLAVSFRHIEGLVGTTSVVANGAPATPGLVYKTIKNGAGVSFDALDASLNVTWIL